ncbi:amidinotransferase [Streptomyces flavotricini]|uniref:Amidinotransferase n=1 Tax=Streptomyces flavotricini TaxID=66888 RepID=A0ABS8E3A2_9ACTN|nr:amidinotransferase [Streptomyces flavotricini]
MPITDAILPAQQYASRRVATPRRLLMCRPEHFDVVYSINPWMHPDKPCDAGLALAQWEKLYELYRSLGHTVDVIDPLAGLPDMVFAANGATVVDGKVLGARFRHAERTAEGPAYLSWLHEQGFDQVLWPEFINEGEGDYLLVGRRLLAGTGFRTDPRSHAEAQEFFGVPVTGLTLVNPEHYHLDTALAVLSDTEIMYYPEAFSPGSRAVLEELFPDAVLASPEDAAVFGLNAFSDGYNVIMPEAATGLAEQLRQRGFNPIGVDLSELLKAGGSAKCCTLELRSRPVPGGSPDARSRAPRTATERALAAIWAEVLGSAQEDRERDFFGAGGDSLLVTRVVLRARKTWDIGLTVQVVLDHPVLKDLAEQIDLMVRSAQAPAQP